MKSAKKTERLQHPPTHKSSPCPALIGKWRVIDRHCNYSRFGGGRYQPSQYSALKCLTCGARWRTNADYVALVKDATPKERFS